MRNLANKIRIQLLSWWRNISITTKLYSVLGIMSLLIAGELLTIRFAMNTLSAVRAFVGGEGTWSKEQKNAAFAIQRYAVTRDEKDFEDFQKHFTVSEGDRTARLALMDENPDFETARKGFLQGQIHADDIDPILKLLQRFYWVSYIKDALKDWAEGDRLMQEFKVAGESYHHALLAPHLDQKRIREIILEIQRLNVELTAVENHFSETLSEGSRWLEHTVNFLLFCLVITVESIGLLLTFFTTRALSRGLRELTSASKAIGSGDYTRRVPVHSSDEIGVLSESVNKMGATLQRSYQELEKRVHERTLDLEKSIQVRDTFLSIASHELKTPLSSMKLQTQLRQREIEKSGMTNFTSEQYLKNLQNDNKQIDRLVRLIDEMLDIATLHGSKRFTLKRASVNLSDLLNEILERFSNNIRLTGATLTTDITPGLIGNWDPYRVEQVFTNLLTNALKYGGPSPIHVRAWRAGKTAFFSVTDHGIGIAPENHSRIFEQFERVDSTTAVGGLGLGLYIVKEIVSAHEGTISVKSESGKGSTFTVSLPFGEHSEISQPGLTQTKQASPQNHQTQA